MNSEYQSLSEVRQNLRVDWYRSPVDPARLRELMRRSDWQGWLQAGGHLALVLATGVVCYLLWARGLWLAFAVALFVHGTFSSFLPGAAVHELGHGTVLLPASAGFHNPPTSISAARQAMMPE